MATEAFNKVICFVRHPKTKAPQGVCYGNSDVMTDETDLNQAVKKVNTALMDFSPTICYSSPLSRCRLLAGKLMSPEKIEIDNRLREINFAAWEMKPWSQIPPEHQTAWGKDFINCKIHGGENFYDVQNRIIQFWETLAATHHQNIMVVTHAGLLRALLAYLLDAAPQKVFAIEVDYGDVIQIKWDCKDYYKIKFL
ncbi:histidine phosphatase family protein [Geofilum sp. OHC36d9]|uniref:histidine phosphatase family protein n=1 Tax=Geofilum sp. OHC36d9 TaxID=3458413 RepID=UPI0040341846